MFNHKLNGLSLLGSEYPINEILNPHLLDQKHALGNQFEGMTLEPFTYQEYEQVRKRLIELIQSSLTIEDKKFLLQFKNLSPIWDKYSYADFPSVRWKLHNLERLKKKNSEKHAQLYTLLEELLEKKLSK